jgi:hypothetical protein
MKHAILIALLMFVFRSADACSCGGSPSFCNTFSQYNFSGSCVVVDSFQYGISLKVLHKFHGTENRDTITVWDFGGPYDMCNDSASFASASFLGYVGDTIIIALPVIDTIKNSWDVIGDYRTPSFTCEHYNLTVRNDTVRGFISGPPFCFPFGSCINKYGYNDFLVDFPTKSLSCETWLSTNTHPEKEVLNYYPNPATDKIVFTTAEKGTLTITNEFGQFIDTLDITNNQTPISTTHLRSGIYFITFQTERTTTTKKLVVQQ